MRKFKLIIAIVLSVSLCVGITLFTVNTSASDGKMWFQSKEKTDAYIFPEYKGEEPREWDEILESLQVPENLLKDMSTDGVIETCFNYPIFFAGMTSSNVSMYAGFQKTYENFNGLQELFQRKDSGKKLLEFYQGIDYEKAIHSSDYTSLRVKYIEYIITQEEVLSTLSVEERSILKSICVKNVIERYQKYSEYLYVDSVLLIIARISNMDDPKFSEYAKENGKILAFLNEGLLEFLAEDEFTELKNALNIQWEGN